MKHTIYIPAETRRDRGFILLCSAVAAGVLIGAFCAVGRPSGVSPLLHQYFTPMYSGSTPAEVFRNSLVSSMLFLAAAFIAGLCAVGQPFGAALLVYRGFGIGMSAAIEYAARGAGAVPAVALLILPKAAAFIAVSMLSVRELMRSSTALMKYLVSGESRERTELRLYCIRFAVLSAVSLFISAVDSVLNYLFAGLV